MDERGESNHDLESPDIFTLVNNYFLLLFGVACVMSSVYIQGLFIFLNLLRIGISISAAVGIILPIYLFTRRFPPGFRRQLCIGPPKPSTGVYVILATLMSVVAVDFIYILTQRFFPTPSDFIEGLNALKPDGPGVFALTYLGVCIVVPIAEELVFRGLVQQVFSRNMNGIAAFVLAGFFFGVIHLNAHMLISISFFGIFLGFVFYVTKNLTYTIISHAVFNTVSFIQLATTPTDQFGEPPFYIQDIRFLVGSLILFVFFLKKIKKEAPEKEPF